MSHSKRQKRFSFLIESLMCCALVVNTSLLFLKHANFSFEEWAVLLPNIISMWCVAYECNYLHRQTTVFLNKYFLEKAFCYWFTYTLLFYVFTLRLFNLYCFTDVSIQSDLQWIQSLVQTHDFRIFWPSYQLPETLTMTLTNKNIALDLRLKHCLK